MGEDKEPTDGRWFFGFLNFKWFVREVRKIYSNEPSYFSKKRLESGAAFTVFLWGMIVYFAVNVRVMEVSDLLMWATPLLIICGYQVNQIQKEKADAKANNTSDSSN